VPECDSSPAYGRTSPVVFERQEELLRSLSELTCLRPGERDLPPEFRLQLQILNCAVHQRRLLQQMAEQQMRMAAQVEALCCQGNKSHELTKQHMEEVQQRFDQLGSQLLQQAPSEKTNPVVLEEVLLETDSQCTATHNLSQLSGNKAQTGRLEDDLQQEGLVSGASPIDVPSLERDTRLRRILNSSAVDVFCAAVISCNAITIGISTQEAIAWQLEHSGGSAAQPSAFIRNTDSAFLAFYCMEMLLKLAAFRSQFFCGDAWKWNTFDLLLVVSGIYDFVSEMVASGSGQGNDTSVTWMRLVRLAKMAKMLRVVRVMRLFRVLRMMVTSIASNFITLIWTIVMLFLVMYIFGLCFLQGLSGYLQDTPANAVPAETMEAIRIYWGSVQQSIITLYFTVTGGSDWEPLAEPLRHAGAFYYILFLFYVAFLAFAVLNVLTGLYAEEACKVSDRDDEQVLQELNDCQAIGEFRQFMMREQGSKDSHELFSWETFEQHFKDKAVQEFMKVVDLTPLECGRVFKFIDSGKTGRVPIENFIDGCLRSNGATVSLEVTALTVLVKKVSVELKNAVNSLAESRATTGSAESALADK